MTFGLFWYLRMADGSSVMFGAGCADVRDATMLTSAQCHARTRERAGTDRASALLDAGGPWDQV